MVQAQPLARVPRDLLALLAVYCGASLIHFVHNATLWFDVVAAAGLLTATVALMLSRLARRAQP